MSNVCKTKIKKSTYYCTTTYYILTIYIIIKTVYIYKQIYISDNVLLKNKVQNILPGWSKIKWKKKLRTFLNRWQ